MQGGFGGGGGAGSGSMSTVSREDNVFLSSEDSSSPDDGEIELGLGLSIGGFKAQQLIPSRGQYARILTAKDLPSGVSGSSSISTSSSSSSSLSSSSSTLSRASGTAGNKRTADSVASPNGSSQVVGWPPIRASRMNSMINQVKSVATEEFNSMIDKSQSKNSVMEKTTNSGNRNNNSVFGRTSRFVKVNMDGFPIGRKVDLSAHSCYETLAQTLEEMFLKANNAARPSIQEYETKAEATRSLKLLDGSSEFVLTYEDREGDWMLVGDVPWGMFLCSARRLRIMRTSEATGLDPRSQESNGIQ